MIRIEMITVRLLLFICSCYRHIACALSHALSLFILWHKSMYVICAGAQELELTVNEVTAYLSSFTSISIRFHDEQLSAICLSVARPLLQDLGLGPAALTPSRNNGFLNMLEAVRRRVRMLATALPTYPSLVITADGISPQVERDSVPNKQCRLSVRALLMSKCLSQSSAHYQLAAVCHTRGL